MTIRRMYPVASMLLLFVLSCLTPSNSSLPAHKLGENNSLDNSVVSFTDDPNLPTWILTPPTDSDYIYGVGVDSSIDNAKKRALINTARQFSGHITTAVYDWEVDGHSQKYLELQDEIRDQTLYGAKFADNYRDNDNNEWILVRAPVNCLLDMAEWVIINHILTMEDSSVTVNRKNFPAIQEQITSIMDGLQTVLSEPSKTYYQPIPAFPDDFVRVEPGRFMMGSPETEKGHGADELLHSVEISQAYHIAKFEVTQKLWEDITGFTLQNQNEISDFPSLHGQGDDFPIYHISWFDAVSFCNKLSLRRGLTPAYSIENNKILCDFNKNGYRLPTEAEWEYASRGGHLGTKYSTYSGYEIVDQAAWYWLNSGDKILEELYPGYYENTVLIENNGMVHSVGMKGANELGLYDLSGNVSEWCWDWYDLNPNTTETPIDPTGPRTGTERVHRGGNWAFTDNICRSASRVQNNPNTRDIFLGLRLVRTDTMERD